MPAARPLSLQRANEASAMPDLSTFPIATRWPAKYPDPIQLYSLNTPNGVKVSIMIEETGLPYEPRLVEMPGSCCVGPAAQAWSQ
jgi:GST-like protein